MDIVTTAVLIVAVALGGGTALRSGAGASLAFALGLLVALVVYTSGGAVLRVG